MDLAIKLHFDLRSTPLLKNPLLPFPSPPFLTIRASLKPSKSNSNPNLNLAHVSSRLSALAVDSPERATSTSSALDDVESLFSDSNKTEFASKRNSKRSNAGASSVSSGVRLENVSKTYKGATVLRDVSWEVKKGEKVGLVGVNGAGKTTQLRIITGLEEPDSGNVVKAKENMKIAFLNQEFEVSTSRTVKEEFLSAFKEEMEISAKLDKVQKAIEASVDDLDLMGRLLDEFDNLQRKAQAVDLDLVEAKVSKLMPELGFSPEDSDRLVASFSGGWQMRMCLGKILLQDPDLLLLDEPTNHLDLDTIEWLEEYLGKQDVPMVIISHDRAFLDQLCTKIVETDMGVSKTFIGNYSDYVVSKATWIEAQYAAWEKQQKEIEQTRDIISRLGAGANSGRASTAEKKLEKLQDEEQVEKPFVRKQMKIRFPERGVSGKSVVTINNLQFGYGDNMLFRQANLTIQRGEKVAILGPNGCGKSTLLKLIMGFDKPVSGEVIVGEHNVLPNYFEQNQAEALDLDKTVLEAVAEVAEDWRIDDIKGLLGRCNFKADMLDRKVSLLSGGEKARLAFCKFMVKPSTLLVLDEPTNHLDIPSKEMLEEAISEYTGTVIAVSHDRYFIKQIVNRVIEVNNGRLQDYAGDYNYYLEKNLDARQRELEREEELEEKATKVKAKSKMSKAEKEARKKQKMLAFQQSKANRRRLRRRRPPARSPLPPSIYIHSILPKLQVMSKVILGMPGPWADNKCEAADHYTTKIGGLPDWPFPKQSLPSDLLLCSACGSSICLVAQIYAPISNATINIEERTIYVFCCISLNCGRYSAVRIQKPDDVDEVKSVSHEVAPLTESSVGSLQLKDHNVLGLGDDVDDDDDEIMDLEKLRMAFSKAAISPSDSSKQDKKKKKSKASKKKCLVGHPKVGEVASHSLVLPCFYTYDEVEKSTKDLISMSASCSSLSNNKKKYEKDDHPQEAWEEESYEYDRALSADRTYLKFKKIMDAYPEQCFRYGFGGKPLLATNEHGDPVSCDMCGGSRNYEMQLMSPFLYFLQQVATGREKEFLDSWNWMTLLIYTCSKSCSKEVGNCKDGWVIAKEAVIPQLERLRMPQSELTSN
ncbi:hypothetical protein V2J09_021678 [Rumex salicifolius]